MLILKLNINYALIIYVLAWLLLPANLLWAGNSYLWDFNKDEDLKSWNAKGDNFTVSQQNSILKINLTDNKKEFTLISPDNLRLHLNNYYFIKIKIRVLSPTVSQAYIMFRPSGEDRFIYNKLSSFDIKYDEEFQYFKINLAEFINSEPNIDQFSITFINSDSIEIDLVEIYESFTELLLQNLKDGLIKEENIRQLTINSIISTSEYEVRTPIMGRMTIPVVLYVFALIIFASIILLKRKLIIYRAFIISFVSIGFIYALRMDYNWFMLLKKDIFTFSGKNITEIINILEGNDFFKFILFVKNNIPEDKTIRPVIESTEDYFIVKGKYYLLPIKTSNKAEFIWLYNREYNFDETTNTLTSGDISISPVKHFATFRPGAEIYQVIK